MFSSSHCLVLSCKFYPSSKLLAKETLWSMWSLLILPVTTALTQNTQLAWVSLWKYHCEDIIWISCLKRPSFGESRWQKRGRIYLNRELLARVKWRQQIPGNRNGHSDSRGIPGDQGLGEAIETMQWHCSDHIPQQCSASCYSISTNSQVGRGVPQELSRWTQSKNCPSCWFVWFDQKWMEQQTQSGWSSSQEPQQGHICCYFLWRFKGCGTGRIAASCMC